MITRTISGNAVTFTNREPHWSHMLATCPDCKTYTFLSVHGGNLNECAEDCPNHPKNNPYPDYTLRYFAEVENVENAGKTLASLSGLPRPDGPDEDGFYRRQAWAPGTTENRREIFIPGTGWVRAS